MWWTIAFICLACFSANVALQYAPEPVTARVIAWRDDATRKASCRLAFLTSHVDAPKMEEG
jgi:hypothetical protein